jgi:hypothetical protein
MIIAASQPATNYFMYVKDGHREYRKNIKNYHCFEETSQNGASLILNKQYVQLENITYNIRRTSVNNGITINNRVAVYNNLQ